MKKRHLTRGRSTRYSPCLGQALRGKRNAGRGFIKNRVDIDMRPSIVDQKARFGDLEIDTVIGKNHKGALLTINDRVTALKIWMLL